MKFLRFNVRLIVCYRSFVDMQIYFTGFIGRFMVTYD